MANISTASNLMFCSVLDNKELAQHETHKKTTQNGTNSAFIKSYYRRQNLMLANALNTSSFKSNKTINKTVISLRCCRRNSLIEQTNSTTGKIIKSSHSCKNNYCHSCNVEKSNIYSQNVQRFLDSKLEDSNFKGLHAYFLTLTIKYDKELSIKDNIKKLRAAYAKMKRNKQFLIHFAVGAIESNFNSLASFECTFSKSSIHYHLHIIILSNPIKSKVKDLQEIISKIWLATTGDSFIVSLDLVRNLNTTDKESNSNIVKVSGVVKELFKYSVKLPSLISSSSEVISNLAEFIIETKSMKRHILTGLFRELKLKDKIKYEASELTEIKDLDNRKIVLVKTSSVTKFSDCAKFLPVKRLKEINEIFKIDLNLIEHVEMTDLIEQASLIVNEHFSDQEFKYSASKFIDELRRKEAEFNRIRNLDEDGFFHFNRKAADNMNNVPF